jgi:hypothetical protein
MQVDSLIKTMVANETLPSFIASDWQGGDDDFQLQADDFDTLFDEPEAELSAGVEGNVSSTEPSCQKPTSWPFQDTQGPKSSGSETKMVFTDAPQLPSSTNAPGQGFVNVYLIVDPATQQVFCPKQLLVYNSGAETQTAMFGPMFLNSFPNDTIRNLANHVTQESPGQFIAPGTYSSASVNHVPIAPFSPTTVTQASSYPDNAVSSNSNVVSVSSSDSQSSAPPLKLAPLRALSAYNFFFRDERDRILHGGPMDLTPAKQHRLLREHCCQDRTKKRRHRKTHGKIDFTTLSKLISKRWNKLPEEQKAFYRQVASLDWERYQTVLSEQRNLKIAATVAPTGSNNFFAITG